MNEAGFPLLQPHRDKVGANRLQTTGKSFATLKLYNRKGNLPTQKWFPL